jgi:hypothetical protein
MAGDAFRVVTFLTLVQPRLVSVFVQRRGSHPHLDDELTNQIAGFGSLFSSIKQSLQLLRSPFAFNATINPNIFTALQEPLRMAGNMSFSGSTCPLPFLSRDNYTSGGGCMSADENDYMELG